MIGEALNELALFAGAGGGILGGKLLGWRTICAVEIEEYCRRVLMQRQDDGILEPFPIWDDVRTFDGKPWRGRVDVVSGGFPCQDISCAGKGAGIDGERSGLWSEMARIIREVQPRYAFVENSPMLTSRGLYRVLGDLAEMGFDARWGVLGADDAGAPHRRKRIWIVAFNSNRGRFEIIAKLNGQQEENTANRSSCGRYTDGLCDQVSYASSERQQGQRRTRQRCSETEIAERKTDFPVANRWWESQPSVGRVADGVANRVGRLRAIGNGQVPAVAALAWEVLT